MKPGQVVLTISASVEILFLSYNPFMNKRAKKRIRETIEKENLERAKLLKEQLPPSSKEYQDRRGFTPKPAKKRG